MASSSGTSSGCSEEEQQQQQQQAVMDMKRTKRMASNRESARRSRLRKQKQVEDLKALLGRLKEQKQQLLCSLSSIQSHFIAVEGENSVLRTQFLELTNRLNSLNEILQYMNGNGFNGMVNNNYNNYNNYNYNNYDGYSRLVHMNQPIVASAEMLY